MFNKYVTVIANQSTKDNAARSTKEPLGSKREVNVYVPSGWTFFLFFPTERIPKTSRIILYIIVAIESLRLQLPAKTYLAFESPILSPK